MTTLLSNCNIVDLEHGFVEENSSVLVSGNLIQDIGRNAATTSADLTIDLQGFYLMPGLFNAHSNISNVFPFKNVDLNESPAVTVLRCYRRAYDSLMAGVTTLRTMGEIHRADLSLRKMINEKWVQGPRILAAGKGIGITGGHGSHIGQNEADGFANCVKAARRELAFGADHLKIFITGGIAEKAEKLEEPQMSENEMRAVASVANSKGTYVAAHAGSSNPIQVAIRAGVRSIEHGYILDRETVRAMRENECYFVPTLSVTRSPNWMEEHGFESWTIEKAVSAGNLHLESVKLAVKEGVKIVCGTDLPPGDIDRGVPTTVREIEYLVEAGLSPIEALRASTIRGAELCLIQEKVGLIKRDYAADVIAVPIDPLKDLKSLREIKFVMKDGEIIRNGLSSKA